MEIGYVKGYDICNITKRILKKDDSFNEIIKTEPKAKEYVQEALEDKENFYQILGLKKKDTLKIIYIYKQINGNMTIQRRIISKDIDDEVINKFNEAMKIEEKEGNDETSTFSVLAIPVGMYIGVMFGVVYDNIPRGLSLGLCMGIVVMGISSLFKNKG